MDIPVPSLPAFERWLNEVLASDCLGFSVTRVIEEEAGSTAGLILLSNIDHEQQTAEMGTWLGESYQGSGLNRWAKEEMCRIAFDKLGLTTLLLFTAQKNIRSRKALAKLPYVTFPDQIKYAKMKRHREFLCGQPLLIYEVNKSDFQAYFIQK